MGFLDFLTRPINQLTSAVGVRLFPNGPYSDAGMGDKAQEQTNVANGYGSQMAYHGNQLLNGQYGAQSQRPGGLGGARQRGRNGTLTGGRMGGDTGDRFRALGGVTGNGTVGNWQGTSLTGALQNATSAGQNTLDRTNPGLRRAAARPGQILQEGAASLTNARNEPANIMQRGLQPLQGQYAGIPDLLKQFQGFAGITPGDNDPYSLGQYQQGQLNNQTGQLAAQKAAAIKRAQAILHANGRASPGALAAIEQQLNDHYNEASNTGTNAFMENARATKQNAVPQVIQALMGLGGVQTDAQGRAIGVANQNYNNMFDEQGRAIGQANADYSNLSNEQGRELGVGDNQFEQLLRLFGAGTGALQGAMGQANTNANVYQNLGQAATANSNNSMNNLGGLLGLLAGIPGIGGRRGTPGITQMSDIFGVGG